MARGTTFGGWHSHRDLHLIQQSVDVQPAAPKTNLVNIPGADGSKDLSTQPAGRVVFGDRKITWTFALYPGENWDRKHQQVSSALNGLACEIVLDSDPDYYYEGRLTVKKYKVDGLLRQITIEATCRPYKLKRFETKIVADLTTAFSTLPLVNERKIVIPTITVTAETTLRWKGGTLVVAAGTHRIADIELQPGANLLDAKVTTGTGKITVAYREGAL